MSQNHNENRNALLPIEENGKTYWRSLDHVAGTSEFQDFVHREFPEGASELTDPVTRRNFMSLMGASVALAGFGTGCVRRPEEKILPYVRRPEDLVPGLPQFYATTMTVSDMVTGLVVEAHEGRPTKVEGNKLHPASRGGACSFEQAAVLSLYDPDRTVRVFQDREERSWADFDAYLDGLLQQFRGNGGAGLVIVSEPTASPTFARMRQQLTAALPQARFFQWAPVSNENVLAGTRLAFGQALEPVYRIDHADVLVSVDADLFGSGPFHLRYSRDWASRRSPDAPGGMNRLYAVEPVFSVTGAAADHRLRLRSSQIGPFLRALAAELQKQGVSVPAGIAQAGDAASQKFVQALAKDLAGKRGRSLVAVGRFQAPEVQAIAWAINDALGNVGETVRFAQPADVPAIAPTEAIRQATQALDAGNVDTLLVLGGNPAYDAPADVPFAAAMQKAKNRIHLTEAPNETSALAQWVLPETHFLEAWGDAVALDGTYSLVQPLIRPIWDGRSKVEILGRLAGSKTTKGYDLVRATFLESYGDEGGWRKALHDGLLEGTSRRWTDVSVDAGAVAGAAGRVPAAQDGLEVVFLVDSKVYDGRFANNAWLQELPEPTSKLTWSNAALMGPALAERLGVANGDMVQISVGGRTMEAGVWVQPGTADDSIAIALGYGRNFAGRVGNDRGFNAYAIRTANAPWAAGGASAQKVAGRAMLATTQDHGSMEGRPLVREANLRQYEQNPYFAREMVQHPPLLALWKQHEYTGQQWGMTIDLNSCVGCNGCMIACQAENNIPVVGPEQVRMGREMYWIRLDRYFAATNPDDPTDLNDAEVVFQPVTCMQCENAPCENVCPVAATVHSKDGGLNDMVYNRCIGTRYCSNNCPYKVRRFNYYDWHTQGTNGDGPTITDVEKMKFNPDVSVRTRGVMEKCSYCIQRINAAKRDAKVSGLEKVPDGGITPACAQACPTEAIVFGDVNDPNSRVSKLKQQPRNYEMLGEYNTKPRTSYLARIRNPNPELVS